MKPRFIATHATKSQKKQALQARSQQTVDNLLQACELIIIEQGIKKLTTNKIAERAGVNIASLYQYFPNKNAIVSTLIRKTFEQHSKQISETIICLVSEKSIHKSTQQVISLALKIYRDNQKLFREILINEQGILYFEENSELADLFLQSGKQFLEKRKNELRVKNLEHSLYILQNSIIPLLLNYLLNPPKGLNDRQFVLQSSDLIARYLLE